MTHRLIAEQWESHCRKVYGVPPAGLSPDQLRECRRCFYAGAQGLLTVVMEMLDPGAEPTEADLVRMDALDDELQAFAKAVQDGHA